MLGQNRWVRIGCVFAEKVVNPLPLLCRENQRDWPRKAHERKNDMAGNLTEQEHTQTHRQPLKAGVVLLAAGEGSRMGGVPKCLLQLEGRPLIARYVAAMQEAGIEDIVVVTGFYHTQIEPVLADFAVTVARNTEPAQGQQSSVRLGLTTLGSNFDVVLVVLADQPLLGKAEFLALMEAFRLRPPGTGVVYPEVQGQRGNPVAFSGAIIAGMLASGRDIGCRKFIDANPALVHKLITSNDHFILDLDTPDDVAAFAQRVGATLTMPSGMAV